METLLFVGIFKGNWTKNTYKNGFKVAPNQNQAKLLSEKVWQDMGLVNIFKIRPKLESFLE